MNNVARFARFNVVGAIGIGVQVGTVAVLVYGLGVGPVVATAVGVTAAVAHNFMWHVRWTWRDRMETGVSRLAAFARFAGANGVVSLLASVAMMPLLVGAAAIPAVPANLVTIAVCGLVNYWIGNRLVFRTTSRVVTGCSPYVPAQPPSAPQV